MDAISVGAKLGRINLELVYEYPITSIKLYVKLWTILNSDPTYLRIIAQEEPNHLFQHLIMSNTYTYNYRIIEQSLKWLGLIIIIKMP